VLLSTNKQKGEEMKLTGNTVLITGGTSGIGFELAKELLKMKNKVIVTGRDSTKLEKMKKQFPEIQTFQSDVSVTSQIESLFTQVTKAFPDLNILINNAGIMKEINFNKNDGSLDEVTREVDINFKGPIQMIKKFLPHLKTKSSSAIITVSSGLAFVPLPISPVYCATKAALHSFCLSLRVQMKNSSVKIFELAPPATQTELLGDMNPEDMKGISVMKVEDMVAAAIKGIEADCFEIAPGQSSQLRFMSRLAPRFILSQLSKPVERMLKETRN
jgi:uncharacterized oxidoreductase